MLAGRGVAKVFKGGPAVLRDVDIEIPAGKATILLGASGSGKSTLIRALALLDAPTSGAITIDDLQYVFPELGDGNPLPPWPSVTVVFQSLFLFPHLSLRANIVLPVRRSLTPGKCAWIERLTTALSITDLLERYPNQVSVGQRQRAALARALALEPRYVLLDEVTSALDVEHVSAVSKLLLETKAKNIGMLVSTHLLGFARDVGDEFVFLDQGTIIERGEMSTLSDPTHPRVRQFIAQTSG